VIILALTDYTKTTWIDRNVSTPNDYVITKSGGGSIDSGNTVTMTTSDGVVTEAGTGVTASNLNKIETQIDELTSEAIRINPILDGNMSEYGFNGSILTNVSVTNNILELSSSIINRTPPQKTITLAGGCSISTAQSVFGGSCIYNAGASQYVEIADNNDFDFGTGDFTVEMRARFVELPTTNNTRILYRHLQSASNYIQLSILNDNGTYKWRISANDGSISVDDYTITCSCGTDTWYYIMFVRSSGNLKIYLDGTKIGSDISLGNNISISGVISLFGANSGLNSNGYFDEIRVSNNARQTGSSFTVPTSAYIADDNTILLIHADGTNGATTTTDDISYTVVNTTGNCIKTYTPLDIQKWINAKYTITAGSVGSTVNCKVLSSTDTVIIDDLYSLEDLSTIDINTYNIIKLKWTLTRVNGSDTSPKILYPRLLWEGSKYLTESSTYNPVSLTAGSQTSTTVTVTGAELGDYVSCSFNLDLALIQVTTYVSATNTVTVVLRNGTAGTIDLSSGTLIVKVWRY